MFAIAQLRTATVAYPSRKSTPNTTNTPARHRTEPNLPRENTASHPLLHSVGRMSRTPSFRNARCLQDKESTTNRAKSQTSCSSERHFNTRDAKSEETVKRSRCFKSLKVTLLGDDRNASWKRCLGALHVGQSEIACHSISQHFTRRVFQQNRQASFTSDSRRPGNAFQRDSCLSILAKSALPPRNLTSVCKCS